MTEEKRKRGRPVTTGTTPNRNVRVGAIWDEAKEIADARGETMSEVVVPIVERGLERYVSEHRNG